VTYHEEHTCLDDKRDDSTLESLELVTVVTEAKVNWVAEEIE
jgi:hypothetical protein